MTEASVWWRRGMPFVRGEELGFLHTTAPPERVVDVDGRDPVRAPIRWRPPASAGPGTGCSATEPWLPLAADGGAVTLAPGEGVLLR